MQEAFSTRSAPGASDSVLVSTDMAERYAHCSWCWKQRYPGQPYPPKWSSTLCPEHYAHLIAQANVRRKQRKGAAS